MLALFVVVVAHVHVDYSQPHIFADPSTLSTDEVKAPPLPPKLVDSEHRMNLAEETLKDTFTKDDQSMEDLDKKIDMDSDDEAKKAAAAKDRFEKRMDDDDSAFEKAMERSEAQNEKAGDDLLKDYQNKMDSILDKAQGLSSFLQTGEKQADKAAADQEAKLVAKIKAQAEAAAKTEIGMKMRELLQQSAEERYGEKQKIQEDREEAHKEMEEVEGGLKRTKERMRQYAATVDGKRKVLMDRLDENEKRFETKLDGEETKLEKHTKATTDKLHAKYEADRKKFEERERETDAAMASVFQDPASFIETGSNLRSGA